MAEESAGRRDLDCVFACFPGKEGLVRRLLLMSPVFRSTCEEYRLARTGLATFEKLAAAGPRPEVPEYRMLVKELETELARMIAVAEADDASGTPEREP